MIINLSDGLKVMEIGAGANPYLSEETCQKYNLDYHIQDIDGSEIDKVEGNYATKHHCSIEQINGHFDLIFSVMVLEHIEDPKKFHQQIFKLLSEKGLALHFFATLYNIASLTNKVLPESISRYLQKIFIPRNLYQNDKFIAFYKWSFGPTRKNIARFRSLNYRIKLYIGFCGHNYFWKWPFLYFMEKKWSSILVKKRYSYLCSNAIILLSK